MRRLLKRKPSTALVVGFLALFVALAGTAGAARLISGKSIKNNSVSSVDIKNGSLLKKDFKRGQIKNGNTGAQGPQGARGPNGVVGVTYANDAATVDALQTGSATATCPVGTVPTGGDFIVIDPSAPDPTSLLARVPVKVAESAFTINPADGNRPNGWTATIINENLTKPVRLSVDAICIPASGGFGFTSNSRTRSSGSTAPHRAP